MREDRVTGQVGRRLLFVDDPDRRVLQGVFIVLVGIDVVLRAAAGNIALWSWPTVGAVLAVLTTLAALLVPWSRLPASALMAVPILDLAVLGLVRLDPHGSGASAVIVVPVLWLGGQFGRRGAYVAGAGALMLMGVPGVLYLGADPVNVARALLLPLVAGWGALAIAVGLERMRAGMDESDRDRKDLAEALLIIEHQRRMSDAILGTVDVGLVLLDSLGAYQTMNRRHEDFIRLAFPDGHEGRAGQLGRVYAADGQTALSRDDMPSRRAANGEEFDDCRIWVGDDPFTRRALSVSARTVRGAHGEFAGAALAYKDVTDFMKAMRVKDEFVASVSHELRTPLTSIVGYVDLLRERDDLHPEQAGQLDVVARNTDRLRRLVADLLHTAQVDDGPLHVVRTPTDLSGVVRDSVEAASPAAKAKSIELRTNIPDTLEVCVDAQRIAQVVDNLVSNAIKYTPDGGTVEVVLGPDADRFELCVADTGIGIEAVDRERLFTRFFRARHAEEHSVQGVGLGLSITKSIVEGHGGRIEVESEVGRGSVFRVRIPRDADPVGAAPD